MRSDRSAVSQAGSVPADRGFGAAANGFGYVGGAAYLVCTGCRGCGMNALRTIVAGAFLAGLAAAQTISITNVTLPNGTVNVSYTAGLSQTGGVAPLTWSATNLPPGLVINNGTGVI